MQKAVFILILIFSFNLYSQNEYLAKTFFDDGDYQKALLEYKKLLGRQPSNSKYIVAKANCLQQLEQFDEAEKVLSSFLNTYKRPGIYVELGYNFALQKDSLNAFKNYDAAIKSLDDNPNYAFQIGKNFEKHNLLLKAKETYLKATVLNPKLNFDYNLASLYGQLGDIQKMFTYYINILERNPRIASNINRLMSTYISSNPKDQNNIKLKT